MCVIIKVEAHKTLPKEVLKNCYENNPDGYGMMVAESDGLHFYKDVKSFDDFYRVWKSFNRARPRAIHFRRKTHGLINKANCHPFFTSEGELGFMHNGVISGVPELHKDMNDTYNFMMQEIVPMVQKFPDIINEPKFYNWLERMTGSNKFLFLTKAGNYHLTNTSMWHTEMGVMFSNAGSHKSSYTAKSCSHGRGNTAPNGRNMSHNRQDHMDDMEDYNWNLLDSRSPEASNANSPFRHQSNIDNWEADLREAQKMVSMEAELDKSSEEALIIAQKACEGVLAEKATTESILSKMKEGVMSIVKDGVRQPKIDTSVPSLIVENIPAPIVAQEVPKEPVGEVEDIEIEEEEDETFPFFPSETELLSMSREEIADMAEDDPDGAANTIMILMGRV